MALSVLWSAFIVGLMSYMHLTSQISGIGELVLGTLVWIVLPILGGWVLVYAAVWTIKWIMAGFNSKEKNI